MTPAEGTPGAMAVPVGLADRDRPDAWIRWIAGWHLAFWLLIALAVVWSLAVERLDTSDRIRALALLAVLSLAYAATVHRRGMVSAWRGRAYLLVAIPVTGLACALDPSLSLLLFLVYPQTWMFSEHVKEGAFFTGVLTVAVLLGFLTHAGWSGAALRNLLPQAVASLLFSVLLGFWISRIIDQSGERADLIAQLEATRSELAEAEHARGVMSERERLARELHDTLAQGFTSIVMLAQVAGAAVGKDERLVTDRLGMIEDVARENLAEARALVAAFSPVGLDGQGVRDAVRRLAERFGRETGLVVDLDVADGVVRLTRDQEVVVLRSVQEALANVRRHAHAQRVTIRLLMDEDGARVEIGDDGVGFAPGTTSEGFGLAGMRGRVAEVGGDVDVASTPGGGTRVVVRVPAVVS